MSSQLAIALRKIANSAIDLGTCRKLLPGHHVRARFGFGANWKEVEVLTTRRRRRQIRRDLLPGAAVPDLWRVAAEVNRGHDVRRAFVQ